MATETAIVVRDACEVEYNTNGTVGHFIFP